MASDDFFDSKQEMPVLPAKDSIAKIEEAKAPAKEAEAKAPAKAEKKTLKEKEDDNGYPALTAEELAKETLGKALGQSLAGTKFHRMTQMRGQQGIGAAGCTMLSLITTGKQIQVISGTAKHTPFMAEMTIDPKKNEPKIIKIEEIKKEFLGLAIKAKFKDVKYQKSEQSPLEYLRRTAIANPHAKIIFTDPFGEKSVFERTSKTIPQRPVEVKPHPKGVTVDELLTMAKATQARKISSFLKSDFD